MPESLKFISYYWDIQNIHPPTDLLTHFVRQVRAPFESDYVELGFTVVCDAVKELEPVLDILNILHINVVHVSTKRKNSADFKLQSLMRTHSRDERDITVVLITNDIDFKDVMHEIRYAHHHTTALVHNQGGVASAMLSLVHQHGHFEQWRTTTPFVIHWESTTSSESAEAVADTVTICPFTVIQRSDEEPRSSASHQQEQQHIGCWWC